MTSRHYGFNVDPSGTSFVQGSAGNLKADDGTPASIVSSGTGGSIRSSNVNVHSGTEAMRIISGSQAADTRLPVPPGVLGADDVYWFIPALPSATLLLYTAKVAGTTVFRVSLSSAGKLLIQSPTGATWATSAASITPGRINRLGVIRNTGTNSTDGSVTVELFNGDSTSADVSVTATGRDLGSGGLVDTIDLGCLTVLSGIDQTFDDVVSNDTGTRNGPYLPVNTPPTLTLTSNQDVAAGSAVTVTATAADPDGSITSLVTTVLYSSDPTFDNTDLTGATTGTITFTAPAAGHLIVLQTVATDNNGATTTRTTEVRVPLSGAYSVLPGAGANGAWTNVGGAASQGAALSDASATTYVESPDYSGTESETRFRMQPITSRSGNMKITVTAYETALGGTLKARLYEGTTLRQEWTLSQTTATPSGTNDDQVLTVTAPEAIGDWGNLYIAFAEAS